MIIKKIMLLIALCFLGSLTSTSASAQVVHVSMSNLTFVGASICGTGSTPCTETVYTSFDWNVTTASIVSGSMSTLSSGAMGGSFSFASTGSVAGGQGFLWTDTNGDSVSVNTCGLDCGKFPSTGVYNTRDITILCSAADTCSTDGFQGTHPTSGTFTVSSFLSTPMTWSSFAPSLLGRYTISTFTVNPDALPIRITRIQGTSLTQPSFCRTNAVVSVSAGSAFSNLVISAQENDSGEIEEFLVEPGAKITLNVTAPSECPIPPAAVNIVVQYSSVAN